MEKTGIADQERGANDEKFTDEKGMHFETVPMPAHITGNGVEASEPKMSYWKSMRFYTGRYTDAPLWKIAARPFIMFWYPAVLWGFLIYGTTLTWIVVFSVVNGVLFVAPPYNFSVGEAGLTSLSPFILCIIGEAISGPLNDYICLKLAKVRLGRIFMSNIY